MLCASCQHCVIQGYGTGTRLIGCCIEESGLVSDTGIQAGSRSKTKRTALAESRHDEHPKRVYSEGSAYLAQVIERTQTYLLVVHTPICPKCTVYIREVPAKRGEPRAARSVQDGFAQYLRNAQTVIWDAPRHGFCR